MNETKTPPDFDKAMTGGFPPVTWGLPSLASIYAVPFAVPFAVLQAWGRARTKAALHRWISPPGEGSAHVEHEIRQDERTRERVRIMHELHDTLLSGFLAASMLLDQGTQQTPADSPSKPALCRALVLMRRAIDDGRAALRGLDTVLPSTVSLEEALAAVLHELAPESGVRLQIFVTGKPQALDPVVRDQLFLLGREAIVNALRHSHATKIEIEVQYVRRVLRLLVRDNGCGIDRDALQRMPDSHWGLRGMRERAEHIGAQFSIWSRPGAGTEVHVTGAFGSDEKANSSPSIQVRSLGLKNMQERAKQIGGLARSPQRRDIVRALKFVFRLTRLVLEEIRAITRPF